MLRDWEDGQRVLMVAKLIRLAKYFDVTVDYLMGL